MSGELKSVKTVSSFPQSSSDAWTVVNLGFTIFLFGIVILVERLKLSEIGIDKVTI